MLHWTGYSFFFPLLRLGILPSWWWRWWWWSWCSLLRKVEKKPYHYVYIMLVCKGEVRKWRVLLWNLPFLCLCSCVWVWAWAGNFFFVSLCIHFTSCAYHAYIHNIVHKMYAQKMYSLKKYFYYFARFFEHKKMHVLMSNNVLYGRYRERMKPLSLFSFFHHNHHELT